MEEATKQLTSGLHNSDIACVRSALNGGADVDGVVCKEDGTTILHLAASLASPTFLIEILRGKRLPNFRANKDGQTPLHVASHSAHSMASILLLASTYGVSAAVDANGDTFLHLLMGNTFIEEGDMINVVEWLFLNGGSSILNVTNRYCFTAYDIAQSCQPSSVVCMLSRNGAISGKSIQKSELFLFESEEKAARDKIIKKEAKTMQKINALRQEEIAFFHKIHKMLGKVRDKEEKLRDERVVDEKKKWSHMMRRFDDHTRRVHEIVKARLNACLIQRVGRGYACRCVLKAVIDKVQAAAREAEAAAEATAKAAAEAAAAARAAAAATIIATEEEAPIEPSPAVKEEEERVANNTAQESKHQDAALAIESAYVNYLRRKREREQLEQQRREEERLAHETKYATVIQARYKAFAQRKKFLRLKEAAVRIQRQWQQYAHIVARRRMAIDIVSKELQRFYFFKARRIFILEATEKVQKDRIGAITSALTQLVWRENFSSEFRRIVFQKRRRGPSQAPKVSKYVKWKTFSLLYERYLLLAQLVISLFLLIYMGCVPRTIATNKHNKVDITFICVQIVIALCLPPSLFWRMTDLCIAVTALVCAATKTYGGSIVIALLILKLPYVVRAFLPKHSGTRTYCRAIEYSVFYLFMLFPFALAGIGSTVRGSQKNRLLLTDKGNWGMVFLYLWSSLSPQYALRYIEGQGYNGSDSDIPLFHMSTHRTRFTTSNNVTLITAQIPIVQLIIANAIILIYTFSALILGTHTAIRNHYDISDETKLKANKHRFRNEDKVELLDAHRAANIKALGQQLDGVMWEADVRAAKEAVDASHYDHNTNRTVQRFVRRVQDSVAQGNENYDISQRLRQKLQLQVSGKWDCRNEDPRTRGTYDIEVIEAALGRMERKGVAERFFQRQWTGQIYSREMSLFLVAVLVMAAARPNLFPMEAAFSAVFAVELVLSLYFLKLDFIFSRYIRLLMRLFCALVGFIPYAVPFAAFRCLRLCEGWSTLFIVPGMVRWGVMYCLIGLVTMWMIAFVAAVQFDAQYPTKSTMCSGTANCLAISLRELVLPAWTPQHVDCAHEAAVLVLLVISFQLFFIPFIASFALHPLLQLSNFIGRFLRLVVQSLHKDVLDYIESYLEGSDWYRRWELNSGVPTKIVVKMKLWVCDLYRRRDIFTIPLVEDTDSFSNFAFPQLTFVDPVVLRKGDEVPNQLNEIICKGEFSTFEENEMFDRQNKKSRLDPLRAALHRHYIHYANTALSLVSVAFLFVVSSGHSRREAVTIISTIVHILSIFLTAIAAPRDLTIIITIISCAALFVAVVLMLAIPPSDTTSIAKDYYALRFLSLCRLAQLQSFPFRRVRHFFYLYTNSVLKVIFPVLVVGAAAYFAELLRAQIILVRNQKYVVPSNETNMSFSVVNLTNLSYPERLMAKYRVHASRPNTQDTADLFAYYFSEDAYIFYSIFSYWLMPCLCISSCLSYLFLAGTNLRDSKTLTIGMIPYLEDPITMADFKLKVHYCRYTSNVVLVLSLMFGCVFSPSTSVTTNDLNLFFGFEVSFCVIGLIESFIGVSYAIHRCGRTWSGWEFAEGDFFYKHVLFGDSFLLVAEIIQVIYYGIAVSLSATILAENDHCIISPDQYATFFITLRFAFLLRLLPRQYILFILRFSALFLSAGVVLVVYFVGAASALADVAARPTGARPTPSLWRTAFDALVRQTFTSATPAKFSGRWTPTNQTAVVEQMLSEGVSYMYVSINYECNRLLFILGTLGKFLISTLLGVGIATLLVPLSTLFLSRLPSKTTLLYNTLSGGINAILKEGMSRHDDMRPTFRRKLQRRKFNRIFTQKGIPSWALPHLLEELCICRPSHQRRFMYVLEQLLLYLPISEKRQARVKQYMDMWECYCSGGPVDLRFDQLPVFPDAEPEKSNPLMPFVPSSAPDKRFVQPLRLVQAILLFEMEFPADSSVGTKLWLDFFSVVQKMRGATLLQSLWRMYREEKRFDADSSRTFFERMSIVALRRSFRKIRIANNVAFRSHASFKEAISFQQEVFNPDTGHHDILNRLRGHYDVLSPDTISPPEQPYTEEKRDRTPYRVSLARRMSFSVAPAPENAQPSQAGDEERHQHQRSL